MKLKSFLVGWVAIPLVFIVVGPILEALAGLGLLELDAAHAGEDVGSLSRAALEIWPLVLYFAYDVGLCPAAVTGLLASDLIRKFASYRFRFHAALAVLYAALVVLDALVGHYITDDYFSPLGMGFAFVLPFAAMTGVLASLICGSSAWAMRRFLGPNTPQGGAVEGAA